MHSAPVGPEVRGRAHRRYADPVQDPARLATLAGTELLDTDAEQAFDRITRLVTRALGTPVGLVSLVDRDRQFFKSAQGLEVRETPLSHSFCQHVVRRAEPLVVPDAREDPLLRDNLAIPDLRVIAYAGVPLVAPDGQVLGSLCAIDGEPRTWSEQDLDVLRDAAGAVMAEVQLRAALRKERRIAETLQLAMLPDLPPAIGGLQLAALYQPAAGTVGGDFYDVVHRGDEVLLVLGDVEGKGLEAAAAAAQLRHSIRGLALAGEGPGTLVPELSRLVDERLRMGYASVVVAELDVPSRRLRWSGAGHPPFLLAADGRVEELRGNHQPLLGVPPRAPVEEERVLPPGSTLLLYTDGVLERRGGSLDEGLERAGALALDLSGDAAALCTALLADVGDSARDDIAVLAARLLP